MISGEAVEGANRAVQELVGLPLTDMWRYGECQKFEFGEQKPCLNRRGEATTRAEWGLVVSCRWRVEGPNNFVLRSESFGPGQQRTDDHAGPFYQSLAEHPPVVESVKVGEDGALRFLFTGGYSLAVVPVFPDEDYSEDWRLMTPDEDVRGHLVLINRRFEWSRSPTP